jgi:AcrR family transcriptional regulator
MSWDLLDGAVSLTELQYRQGWVLAIAIMLPKSTFRCQDLDMGPALKKSYHHGNLRAVLIEAGLEIVAEKGVRALTLREIGARVGVSRTAAYRHFAEKTKLLAAIREAGFEKFAAALEKGRDAAKPEFAARLNAMGVAYVRFAREHPAYFEVMFSAAPLTEPVEASEAEERAFHILQQAIVEAQAKRIVRAGDPRLMACAAWSLVHGIGALKLDRMASEEALAQDEFVTACSTFLLEGMLARKK